jgi:hypothetical protein
VSDRDSKYIARQWNREIEAEIRAEEAAAHPDARGPWRSVVWGVLWIFWLLMLLALATQAGL